MNIFKHLYATKLLSFWWTLLFRTHCNIIIFFHFLILGSYKEIFIYVNFQDVKLNMQNIARSKVVHQKTLLGYVCDDNVTESFL